MPGQLLSHKEEKNFRISKILGCIIMMTKKELGNRPPYVLALDMLNVIIHEEDPSPFDGKTRTQWSWHAPNDELLGIKRMATGIGNSTRQ